MKTVIFAVNLDGQTCPFIQTVQHLRERIKPLIQTGFLTCLEASPDRVDFIDSADTHKIALAKKSGNTIVHIDANMLRALSNTLSAFCFDITRFNERTFDANGALDTEQSQVDFSYTVNNVALRWYGLIDITLPVYKLSAPDDVNPECFVGLKYHWQNEIQPTYLFDVNMGHIEAKDSFFDMKAYSMVPSTHSLALVEPKLNEFLSAVEAIPYFKGTLRLRLKKLLFAWIQEHNLRLTALVKYSINTMISDKRFAEIKAYMEQLDQKPISEAV